MARLYGPGPGAPPTLVWTNDLGGLATRDVEDRPVGELFGALSEEATGLIRYLDVALGTVPRHVLVPIGHVRIDREGTPPRVRLRAATHEDLLEIPAYERRETALDAEYHDRVLEAHGRLYYGARYYAHPEFDHGAMQAGPSPILGPPEAEAREQPPGEPALRPLAELRGYRVAREERDVRGWPVEDEAGERIGEVEDLLVEVAARKARYALVKLMDPPRLTAIPVGFLDARVEERQVVTPGLELKDLRLVPAYEPPMDRAQETRIRATLEARLTGERYYRRPDFRRESNEPFP